MTFAGAARRSGTVQRPRWARSHGREEGPRWLQLVLGRKREQAPLMQRARKTSSASRSDRTCRRCDARGDRPRAGNVRVAVCRPRRTGLGLDHDSSRSDERPLAWPDLLSVTGPLEAPSGAGRSAGVTGTVFGRPRKLDQVTEGPRLNGRGCSGTLKAARADGRDVTPDGELPRGRLLALLRVAPRRDGPAPTTAIEALWPRRRPRRPARRPADPRVPGPPVLSDGARVVDGAGYRLEPARVDVDADRRRARRGRRRTMRATDPAGAAALLATTRSRLAQGSAVHPS